MIIDLDVRKWGDRPQYRLDIELLGRDDHGTWLGLPTGTPYVGPNGPGVLEYGFITVVPEDTWWTASFWPAHPYTDAYADIITGVNWETESHLVLIDLDLDVIRYHDGRIELVDEDEFEENQVAYGYPADVIAGARAAAEEVLALVKERREPFDEVGRRWLLKLRS